MKKILSTLLFMITAIGIGIAEDTNSWKSPGTPSSPRDIWKPPAGTPPKLTGATPIPPSEEVKNRTNWTLTQLIDLALETSNQTRATWNDAKARGAKREGEKVHLPLL